MPEEPPNSHIRQRRRATIIAAGLLLLALGWVVIYTNRVAFRSPLALVVVAAIGVAALILQLRLRPDVSPLRSKNSTLRASLWINAVGVLFALAAVLADFLQLAATFMLISALVAVFCFSVSGLVVLNALRKSRG